MPISRRNFERETAPKSGSYGCWPGRLQASSSSASRRPSRRTLAKHAFQLAQQFNNFYHRHHILTEADEERKRFLLATAAVVRRELIAVLEVMGIPVPPVM